MPTIQTIDGAPPVQRAAYPGSLISAEAVAAPYRALGSVARGLADVGGTVGQFAERSARLKNRADQLRVEQAIKADEADFQTWLTENPDETEWEAEAQRRTQGVSDAISQMDVSPVVRDQVNERLKGWTEDRAVQVRNQAERYANDRHDAVLVKQMQDAADAGDLETANATIDEREILGTVHPAEAAQLRTEMAKRADRAGVATEILNDPIQAVAMLEDQTPGGKPRWFTHLSENDRLTAVRAAKTARETQRAETAQDVAERIYSVQAMGIDTEVDALVASGQLLASQGTSLKKLATGTLSPQVQASRGAALWQAAIDVDRADPDYIQQVMRIRADAHGLDPSVRDPILDTLRDKESDSVTETTRSAFGLLQRDYEAETDRWTKQEIDGLTSAQFKAAGKPDAGDFKDAEKAEAASAKLFNYQMALSQFIRSNPNAPAEDIMRYRSSLTATDTAATLGGAIVDDLTGAAP